MDNPKSASEGHKGRNLGRILWFAIGVFATLLSLVINTLNTGRSIAGLFYDEISVWCPPETFSYEQVCFGTYTPPKNRVLWIYVHPRDGTDCYWPQIPRTEPGGSWSFPVRLGNPCWRNMSGQSPLTYDVFVALSKPNAKLPGREGTVFHIASGEDFARKLRDEGARAVKHVTITRYADKPCGFIPRIIQPVVPANPCENVIVHGEFELKWEPTRKMWVELWEENGAAVPGYPNIFRESGARFQLETGLYEVKVKESEKSRCGASLWIEVVRP